MQIRLSEEASLYVESQLAGGGYRSADEFIEDLLLKRRRAGVEVGEERSARTRLQESAAVKAWDDAEDAAHDRRLRRSPEGILADLRSGVTEEEIAEARREMWGNFPREDL